MGIDKRKLYGTILGSIAFIAVILAATYAKYIWQSDNTNLTFSISDSYFYCESGIESSVSELSPVLDYRSGSVQSFFVNNIGMSDTTFSISLNISSIDESLISESFKYKIVVDKSGGSNICTDTSETDCIEVAEGNFSEAVVGMNTLAETVELPNNSKYEYYLFLYIDGNMENDESMQNSSMSYTLDVCEVVVFFDYNGGSGNKDFLKVASTYDGLPTATRNNTVITYESNGGSTVYSDTITYEFGGWYKEESFSTLIEEDEAVTETTNHTLYAKWNTTPTSGCITLPTTTRTGYTFNGWYTDSGLTTSAGNAGAQYCPNESVTLYAKWTANTYKIAYSMNGGTKGSSAPTSGTYDSVVTIDNPTKSFTITGNTNSTGATISSAVVGNHTFDGWTATNINTSTAMYGSSTSEVTTAWSDGTTKVTDKYFKNLNPTSGATVTMTANWNDLTLTLPTVTKEGYTCNWNTASDGSGTDYESGGSYTVPADNTTLLLTLYAECTANKYDVTYDYNVSQTFNTGQYINTDYIINWDEDFEIQTSVDITDLEARYLVFSDPGSLTVDLEIDGGVVYFDSPYFSGSAMHVLEETEEIEFVFSWEASSRTYSLYIGDEGGYTYTGEMDISGSSDENLVIGTVIAYSDGGIGDDDFGEISMDYFKISHPQTYGTTLNNLPDSAIRTGYTLNGWYTATSGGTQITNSTTMGAADVTYYAQWSINQVHIKLNVNGGTVTETTTNTDGNYTYTWSTDDDGIIYKSVNGGATTSILHSHDYGTTLDSTGLADWNNTSYLYITRVGYTAASNEWICLSGDCETGKTFDQATIYEVSEFCDASNGDCTVVLGVNWVVSDIAITYNYQNNIYNQDTSTWTFHGSSTVTSTYSYRNTTGVAVYSNTNAWTGLLIPLNSDKKQNTNYILSVAGRSGSVSVTGNLRAYTPTYNSSGSIMSYNHGISFTYSGSSSTSGSATNAWEVKSYNFNSGAYSTWDNIRIDYDKANQGPIYISDIRLDEYSTTTAAYGEAMPDITIPTRTGYVFDGYYNKKELCYKITKPLTERGRIELNQTGNDWALTTAGDTGTHIQGKITVTNATAGIPHFNDITLDSSMYTVEDNNGILTYYVDFEVTEEMVTTRTYDYESTYRFIDIYGLTDDSVVTVDYVYKDAVKYYDGDGNSLRNCDFTEEITLYAKWIENSVNVTYYNGSTSLGTQELDYGTAATLSTWSTLGGTVSGTDYGWEFAGWATSTSGTSVIYTDGASVTLTKDTSLYAVYNRTLTFYSGASKATTDGTRIQYYNPKGGNISSVTSYTPASITNWSTLGYRDDTTASTAEYSSASTMTPGVTTGNSIYAVYSRTLTISYDANGGSGTTASTTKTVYLNSNSTTTSDQSVTLASNGFTYTGYGFSKWAAGSSTGTQYSAGGTYTPTIAYDATTFGTTMYAIWGSMNYGVADTCASGTYSSYYSTLANAISGATAGQCITLLKSLTDTSTATFNKTLTLHTNGYTLTRSAQITINSGVSVTKSGAGTITNTTTSVFYVQGNLTATSGVIHSDKIHAAVNTGTGTVTISGATMSNATTTNYSVLPTSSTGTNASAYVMTSGVVKGYIGFSLYGKSILKISGGTVYGMASNAIQTNSHTGTVTISGGTIGSSSYGTRAIYQNGTGPVTISGGQIKTGGSVTSILNNSTGTLSLTGGTYTSAGGVVHNASTGFLQIGKSSNTTTAKLSTTGIGYAAVYCGNNASGSKARCGVYSGAVITTTTGRGVKNWDGDYRQYEGSQVTCSGGDYFCIYNNGSTYSTGTCANFTNCAYGRIYVRRGYVNNTVTAAIGSDVLSSNAVYIGNADDTLYNFTSFTNASYAVNINATGPMVRSTGTSGGRGVYIEDNDNYSWIFKNGLVAGATAYSNAVPSNTRTDYGVNTRTYNSVTYAFCSE